MLVCLTCFRFGLSPVSTPILSFFISQMFSKLSLTRLSIYMHIVYDYGYFLPACALTYALYYDHVFFFFFSKQHAEYTVYA